MSACAPIFKTGNANLDSVIFCIGNYGVTVFVVAVAFVFLLLIFRK